MKKLILAYFLFIGLPLGVLYSGIGSPELAGFLVIEIAISSVILGIAVMCMYDHNSMNS